MLIYFISFACSCFIFYMGFLFGCSYSTFNPSALSKVTSLISQLKTNEHIQMHFCITRESMPDDDDGDGDVDLLTPDADPWERSRN